MFGVRSPVPTLQKYQVSVLKTQRNDELQPESVKNPAARMNESFTSSFSDTEHTDNWSAVCHVTWPFQLFSYQLTFNSKGGMGGGGLLV